MILVYIFLFLFGIYFVFKSIYQNYKKNSKLPSTLPTIPLFGNASYLSKPLLYVDINKKYRKEFGNYLTIWFFNTPILLINEYRKVVDLFINKSPIETSGRPYLGFFYTLTEGNKDIIASNIGPQWAFQRKLVYSALRKFAQNVNLDEHVRKSFKMFKQSLLETSRLSNGHGVNPYEDCYMMSYNITCAIAFGKTFQMTDTDFIKLRQSVEYANEIFLTKFYYGMLPFFRFLPIPEIRKFMKCKDYILNYLSLQIKEHENSQQYLDKANDILDYIMLEKQNDPTNPYFRDIYVRQVLLDIFLAGTDTTALTVTWILGLMATNPDVKSRVKQEVMNYENEMEKEISVADKQNLNYTQAVLNEVFRYSSLAVYSQHEATSDIEYDGYTFPKGTLIMANIYEFHFDENYWDNPYKFDPKRFLDENGELVSKKEGFMAFGCGRRVCVGESVAKADLFLTLCLICKELDLEWCTERNGGPELQEYAKNTQLRYTAEYFINVTDSK